MVSSMSGLVVLRAAGCGRCQDESVRDSDAVEL
jgi:hypothetical protein